MRLDRIAAFPAQVDSGSGQGYRYLVKWSGRNVFVDAD